MTDITTDTTTLADAYLAMWNETDEARRAALVEQAWTPDGHYVDPLFDVTGHAALGEMVAGLHAQYPGHRFRRTSAVDTHHDQLRFGWEFVAPDGTAVIGGIDVGALAGDGRLARIVGFFGELPN